MKKINLMISVIGLCASLSANADAAPTLATGTGVPCPASKADAMNKMIKAETTVADQTIATPDLSFIENCLNSISMPRGNFGLGFPSIQGIMSKVCNTMKSQITSQITNMNYNFNPLGSATGAFSGMPTQQVSYSGNMGTFADSFNGGSIAPITQPISSQMGSALSLPSGSGASPTSNSSYMTGTVSNAMNFLTGSSPAGN